MNSGQPQDAGYSQTGYPPQQPGSYPPQQPGGYPPQQSGSYPPPQEGGYPSMQLGVYPGQAAGGYPPQSGPGYPGQQPGGAYPQGGVQPTAPVQWQPNQDPNSGPSYTGNDVPDSDPEDDENAAPAPVAPPDVSNFSAPPGYSGLSFDYGVPAPPPAYEPPSDDSQKPPEEFGDISTVDEKMIRDAICTFADKTCCYGTGPAENMTFDEIIPMGALHYQLETFTETRKTCWAHKPYSGGFVDGPLCGQAPAVWDIACEFDQEFKTHDKIMEIPHTSSVQQCHGCAGLGFNRCHRCHGRGRVRCSHCHGSGRRTVHRDGRSHRESCSWCHGSGKRRCSTCGGDGRIICSTCTGYGKVRFFIQLTVSYVNNVDDYIYERTDMPDEYIRNVSGQVIFEQDLPFVWPISQYIVPEINVNSIALVERHKTAWPSSKRLKQRQWLRKVPVTEVKFTYKEQQERFWVYGFEHEVHCPEYPSKCCWGCTIM